MRRLNLGRSRKTWPQSLGRNIERDNNFKIAGFLSVGGCLRGGRLSGGTQNRLLAHFRNMTFENLAWNRVDGYVGWLALLHVRDVRFVHLYFAGDDAHI